MPCADLNALRYYYHSNVGFFNPPLTKVDSFLKHDCLHFLYLPGLLAASHRNPVCTCSSRKGHILASVLEKFRKVPLLISFHLYGGKMVLNLAGKGNNLGLTLIRPL